MPRFVGIRLALPSAKVHDLDAVDCPSRGQKTWRSLQPGVYTHY